MNSILRCGPLPFQSDGSIFDDALGENGILGCHVSMTPEAGDDPTGALTGRYLQDSILRHHAFLIDLVNFSDAGRLPAS